MSRPALPSAIEAIIIDYFHLRGIDVRGPYLNDDFVVELHDDTKYSLREDARRILDACGLAYRRRLSRSDVDTLVRALSRHEATWWLGSRTDAARERAGHFKLIDVAADFPSEEKP
jgi:hypothetical protein